MTVLLPWPLGMPPLQASANSSREASTQDTRQQLLDGVWQIAQDVHDRGITDQWYEPSSFPTAAARTIQVPGNINEAWPNPAPILGPQAANLDWYLLKFVPKTTVGPGLRNYLRFGAVRYISEVWLNGKDLFTHEGGEDPFECDATAALIPNRLNTLIVRVASPYLGGINQHVQLVSQPEVRIIDGFARPDTDKKEIRLEVTVENNTGDPASVDLAAGWGEYKPSRQVGSKAAQVTVPPGQSAVTLILPVPQPRLWTFDEPNLYTIGITSCWRDAPSASAAGDECHFRTGFRDFRITDGFFHLNGRRIFLKATFDNWYDPLVIQGTPRVMTYLTKDIPQLKLAGFNAMRFIMSAALPEDLDQADELGLLIFAENETAWLLKDSSKFGISLNQVVRRDRNHPSLVMWGLLNETNARDIYHRAKGWLPSLRTVDDTRLIMLSSGRWDGDFKTGSASNPGSSVWNVFLGGEDPLHPVTTGNVPQDIGAFHPGSGDAHVYETYPTSWDFVTNFENLAKATKPFFLPEAGDGSAYNPLAEKREMDRAGAPATAFAWRWITPALRGLQSTWAHYGLSEIYPSIEDMLADSDLSLSRQRARTFSIVRSNPKVNGFDLTSLIGNWGTGQGIMDTFRSFKPGLLPVLQAGWAPLRWCLLVNPTNVYAGKPLRVRVALANEDILPGGDYPALLKVSGADGVVWRSPVTVHVESGTDAPMACTVFDQDVTLPWLAEGTYLLHAELSGRPNAASSDLAFRVTRPVRAEPFGTVTVLGLGSNVHDLLLRAGAVIRNYAEGEQIDREVILVGDSFNGRAAAWRELYARCARGAHVVFLAPKVFLTDAGTKPKTPRWLALGHKGIEDFDTDWLYHKDVVAKRGPAFAQLQTSLMTPEYYEGLLGDTPFFEGMTLPDSAEAVAIRCSGIIDSAGAFSPGTLVYKDGVMLGTYRHHAGHFTINALNVLGNIGNPAADRLLLNLIAEAGSDAAPIQPLPEGYAAELASLGIADPP